MEMVAFEIREVKMIDDVIALDFSFNIDEPSKYQTKDGEWHTGMIPDSEIYERFARIKEMVSCKIKRSRKEVNVDETNS